MAVTREPRSLYSRRIRARRLEEKRAAELDRTVRHDHYASRRLALQLRSAPLHDGDGDSKSYVNCSMRYCGQLDCWVGWCLDDGTYEVRVEGYPTVTDIKLHVRTPTSSKSLTRAVRYALSYLEQHGAELTGAARHATDGRFAVDVLRDGETWQTQDAKHTTGQSRD